VAKLPSNLKIPKDGVADLMASMLLLTQREVLVGFPEDTKDRKPEPGEPPPDVTNAELAYVHDNGMPEKNVPARPFMLPGIREAQPLIIKHLTTAARNVLLKRSPALVEQGFERAGLAAQFAIRRKINEGIPPPLAKSTLQERARRKRKGAKKELARRAAGETPSTQFAKPLIDTAQMRNAVNYVIRPRKARKK
jgi:hypothetical protein